MDTKNYDGRKGELAISADAMKQVSGEISGLKQVAVRHLVQERAIMTSSAGAVTEVWRWMGEGTWRIAADPSEDLVEIE